MKRREQIEYLIGALQFFNDPENEGVDIYYDIPKDVIDIYIFKILLTFDEYKSIGFDQENFDKDYAGWTKEKLVFKIEVLTRLENLTLSDTVVVLDYEPLELSVKHQETIVKQRIRNPNPRFTTLIEAKVEPEKLQQEVLEQFKKEIGDTSPTLKPMLQGIAKDYVKQISTLDSEEFVPVLDPNAITDLTPTSKTINIVGPLFVVPKKETDNISFSPVLHRGVKIPAISEETSSPWMSPISAPIRTIVVGGVKKIADEDSGTAAAMILPHYGYTTENIYELRARARGLGISE